MAMATAFPKELRYIPKPFVVLTGLDVTYNAIHKSIWDTFSNNRKSDRLQIKFTCLPGDHAFPKCKTKRSSYDWYIPKGILKTRWMEKHLNEIPALVVIFFELDWDELAWRERHLACASRVQVIRSSLQGRSTKVAVVLIQRSTPLPPGEDMVAAERAAALCSACDLSSKSLFVLPHTDHLLGYIIRLETAFFDLAQTYYHSELRRVKAHKEFLSKTTHQLLFPRHQFKIAFYSELMQDATNALKHYQQSYNHIHELRSHATNNLEVKFVGGLVNFKICRLCFLQLNAPLDAINQFRRHIEQFKPQFGIADLMFEHYAWLSQQYLLFADLFKNAIDQGLTAIQTQHPGFYYQQAAHYADLRKQHILSLLPSIEILEEPSTKPLSVEVLDFYGQRPWRQGHQRIDPPDLALEKDGILALQKRELKEDHPWIIIPLLSSAVTQFKKFPCSRLKRYLTIKMGIEYYHAKEYGNVIVYLNRAMTEYRSCQWCEILTQLTSLAFHCAYLLADLENYFTYSLALMGKYSCLSVEEKTCIQKNVCQLLNGEIPDATRLSPQICQLDDHSSEIEGVRTAWKNLLCSENLKCSVEMNNHLSFVECRVKFTEPQCPLDCSIQLEVYTRITSPSLFQFSELAVSLSNTAYDDKCVVPSGKLCYQPNQVNYHVFEFPIETEDVNRSIQVKNIMLKLESSSSNRISLSLTWKRVENGQQFRDLEVFDCHEKDNNECDNQWKEISEICTTEIIGRESRLKIMVSNAAPALTNEIFPLTVSLTSEEPNSNAENINVLVSLKPEIKEDDMLYQATNIFLDPESPGSNTKTIEFSLGILRPGEAKEKVVYVQPRKPGKVSLTVQTEYKVNNIPVGSKIHKDKQLKHVTCKCKSSTDVLLEIIDPFKLTAHVTSMSMQSVSSVYAGQPFLMLASLVAHSPWQLDILSCKHTLPKETDLSLTSEPQLINSNLLLQENETIIDCSSLSLNESSTISSENVDLGVYTVTWKRSGSSSPTVTSQLKLPSIITKTFPVSLNADIPAFCKLRQDVEITYTISNHSKDFEIVEVMYNAADTFMFSGPKHSKVFLAPLSSQKLTYVLIPLALGYQALPQMQVSSIAIQKTKFLESISKESMDNFFLHSSIPTHLYVKPTTVSIV